MVFNSNNCKSRKKTPGKNEVEVLIGYEYKWKQNVELASHIIIHSYEQGKKNFHSYSATGVVKSIGCDVKKYFPGMLVAVIGVSDTEAAECIFADENFLIPIKENQLKTGAIAGLASLYINAIKIAHMTEGSLFYTRREGGLLRSILEALGYVFESDIQNADYIFVEDDMNFEKVREDCTIVVLGKNSVSISGECKVIYVDSPGANWGKGNIQQMFPPAYVSNTVLDNSRLFLDLLEKGEIYLPEQEENFIFYHDVSSENGIKDDNENFGELGQYKNLLSERSKPMMISCCFPKSNSLKPDSEQIVDLLHLWIHQRMTAKTLQNEDNCIFCYEDGSVATVMLVEGMKERHCELHWEATTLVINGDKINVYD